MKTGLIIMGLASLGYLVAAIGSQRDLFLNNSRDLGRWRRVLWVSLAAHTLGLLLYGYFLGHLPITRMDHTIAVLGWVVMVLYLVLGERWKVEVVGTVAAPAAFALTAFSSVALWGGGQQSGAAGGPWLQVHVASLLLGYATFIMAAFCAVLYFVQARLLKQKKVTGLFTALPPLDTLDRVAYRFIRVGFPLLILGIVTGLLISNWTWHWDPKETLVAMTALVYTGYIHARIAGWQGRRVNMLLLVAFGCVLVSYLIPGESHRF